MPAAVRRSAAFGDERGCVAAWNPSRNQPPHPPPRGERHGHPDNESAGATYGSLQGRSAHNPKERAQPRRREKPSKYRGHRRPRPTHDGVGGRCRSLPRGLGARGVPANGSTAQWRRAFTAVRRSASPPSSRYQRHDRRGIRPACRPHLVPTPAVPDHRTLGSRPAGGKRLPGTLRKAHFPPRRRYHLQAALPWVAPTDTWRPTRPRRDGPGPAAQQCASLFPLRGFSPRMAAADLLAAATCGLAAFSPAVTPGSGG
jgi:hypothetical protein